MVRPKNNDRPPYMWPDGDRGGWIVVNPVTGKKKRFRADEEQRARETAQLLNEYLEARRQRELLEAGRPKLDEIIDRWLNEQMRLQPWDESTRITARQRLNRIKRELGKDGALIEDIDVVALNRWLSKTAPKADPFNKWRNILALVWGFAVAQGLAKENEAQKVQPRSVSRKIESNRKTRQPLDIQTFQAVHAVADPLLQLAMEMSLVTLQARNEIVNLRHTDFRDGFLYVIRDKTSGDSDMAFIRIGITPELESFRARAMKLDDLASPYLIHRRPERMQRRWMAGKPHWTYVNRGYLTRLFEEVRDLIPAIKALPSRHKPVFHEIRGLGSRLAKDKGMPLQSIQALMTHSNPRTTAIYLEGGREALTDEHFVRVNAPFTVRQLLE